MEKTRNETTLRYSDREGEMLENLKEIFNEKSAKKAVLRCMEDFFALRAKVINLDAQLQECKQKYNQEYNRMQKQARAFKDFFAVINEY